MNGDTGRSYTERMNSQSEEGFICGWEFELRAQATGARAIAGVDEVGRGPLFGPVVVAAVILPQIFDRSADDSLEGLTDSKKLCSQERERFDALIRARAVAFAVAEVDAATIDRINIREATRLAMRLAVEALSIAPDCLLIDGNMTIEHPCSQQTIVKGDGRSLSIAAASVVAKVYRDQLLCQFDELFPGYGLAQHKGYATAQHREALMRLGPTPLHRRSFNLKWDSLLF